ncbi:MAG: Cupin domain protein [Deltaproteobacteria bacterium ADurb.Bin151]|nr:cupin domain-containing protein [Smithella sp.]OQB52936.1 MAG: Cupin domain protein [Deltaproteobacteria bacterium ADurb.Bin151]HNZ09875.1 cupin domain-containing protein [Smithellaceae bacterium]HOG80856.1 cupin domain-containing protein [Smithellaceae bacterium]HOQ42758.1 cupin domain-containing protein [Smithellaceae bacterium]
MIVKKGIWLWAVILFVMPLCVSAGEYNAGVRGKVILHTDKMSNGEPIDYLDKDHPRVTVMTVEIEPGKETGWHSHPMEVYAYVLSGRLTVEIEGGKTTEFKKGDAIIEVVNVRHNGINKGKIPVKLIVFYLGGEGLPTVIKSDKPQTLHPEP